MRRRRSWQRGARRKLRRKKKAEFREGDGDKVIQNCWPWGREGEEVAGSTQPRSRAALLHLKAPEDRLCSSVTIDWACTVCLAVLNTLFCPHGNPEGDSGRKCNAEKLFLLRSQNYKWWEPRGPDSWPLWYGVVFITGTQGHGAGYVIDVPLKKKKIRVTQFRNCCIRNIWYEA